jgi:hypothetical protein
MRHVGLLCTSGVAHHNTEKRTACSSHSVVQYTAPQHINRSHLCQQSWAERLSWAVAHLLFITLMRNMRNSLIIKRLPERHLLHRSIA